MLRAGLLRVVCSKLAGGACERLGRLCRTRTISPLFAGLLLGLVVAFTDLAFAFTGTAVAGTRLSVAFTRLAVLPTGFSIAFML